MRWNQEKGTHSGSYVCRGLGAYEIEASSPRLWPVEGVPHHTYDTNAVSHNLCYHQAGSMAT